MKEIKCVVINPPQNAEQKTTLRMKMAQAFADIILNKIKELPPDLRKKALEEVIRGVGE